MTDPHAQERSSHWDELAKQLGLPVDELAPPHRAEKKPEPPPPPVVVAPPPVIVAPPPPPPPPVPVVVAEHHPEPVAPKAETIASVQEEPAPHRGRRRRPEAALDELPSLDDHLEPLDSVDAAKPSEPVAETVVGEAAPAEPKGPEEELRPRGRRRGRRSSSSRRPEPAAQDGTGDQAVTETVPAAEGETGNEEDRPRRRRGRRRKKGEGEPEPHAARTKPVDAETPEEDEAELVPLAAEEDSALDTDDDSLKNWNVPSWNELIGSLYRPER